MEPADLPEQEVEAHQVMQIDSDGKFSFAHNTVHNFEK